MEKAKKNVQSWLARQDSLGSPVALSYKLNNTFGTPCGGCMSLIASLLVAAYAIIHSVGVLFANKYEVINEYDYEENRWYKPTHASEDYQAVPMIQVNRLDTNCGNKDWACHTSTNDLYDIYMSITELEDDETYTESLIEFKLCTSIDSPMF